jgi:thiamine pyrophosphate-dependent acetolactate synthase large subunit-like protein
MSGVPGVAVVTAGPGVTNTITALKNAQLAESPVLLLGGAAATLLKNRGALQDIDQMALVRPHVKYAGRVDKMKDLEPTIIKALKIAMDGVMGPVFVECPLDLLYEENLVRDLYQKSESKGKSMSSRVRNWYIRRHVRKLYGGQQINDKPIDFSTPDNSISSHDISKAHAYIAAAERPLLLIGSGAMKCPDLVKDFTKAVENLGIPVYLGGMARGLLGTASNVQYFHKRTKALKEADCIILAGIPTDFRLNYGGHFNRKAKKIAISKNKEDLRKNLKADITAEADPAFFLMQLAKNKRFDREKWKTWKTTLKSREEERNKEILSISQKPTDDINPMALLQNLEQVLQEKSVIIVDGGDFAASAAYTLKPRSPLKWLDPGVFGTLGSGGGFAMGAAMQYPDHYIWIIYGDGSCAYSLMEMDTFRKFGMKVCGIIGNNGSWEQIARDQIHILGRDTASVLPQSNYELIARAFNAQGEKVDDLKAFDIAVANAIKSMDQGIPYVINALIGTTAFREGSLSM